MGGYRDDLIADLVEQVHVAEADAKRLQEENAKLEDDTMDVHLQLSKAMIREEEARRALERAKAQGEDMKERLGDIEQIAKEEYP